MSVQVLLWVIATVLFAVGAFAPGVGAPRFNLVSAGLAFLAAGFIAGAV